MQAIAKRDAAVESRNKARLSATGAEGAALQKTVAVECPDCAACNPASVETGRVRSLLPDGDALVLFAVADMASHVIALMRAGCR